MSNKIVSHLETSAITLPGAKAFDASHLAVHNGVLTVKNQHLADLIHSKISAASSPLVGALAAADADVTVGVKVRF